MRVVLRVSLASLVGCFFSIQDQTAARCDNTDRARRYVKRRCFAIGDLSDLAQAHKAIGRLTALSGQCSRPQLQRDAAASSLARDSFNSQRCTLDRLAGQRAGIKPHTTVILAAITAGAFVTLPDGIVVDPVSARIVRPRYAGRIARCRNRRYGGRCAAGVYRDRARVGGQQKRWIATGA